MKLSTVIAILSFGLISYAYSAEALKAHSHGHAEVNIAVDAKEQMLAIEFEAAANGILGFEWRPKTAKEKNDLTIVKSAWTKDIISIDSSFGCKVIKKDIKLVADAHEEPEDHDNIADHKDEVDHDEMEGEHSEIQANILFKCEKDPSNTQIKLKIIETFNKLKLSKTHNISEIDINVLPAKGAPYEKESKANTIDIKL